MSKNEDKFDKKAEGCIAFFWGLGIIAVIIFIFATSSNTLTIDNIIIMVLFGFPIVGILYIVYMAVRDSFKNER